MAQRNDFIDLPKVFTLDEHRMILLASSKIDRFERKQMIRITVDEFKIAFGVDAKHAPARMRSAVKKIAVNPIQRKESKKKALNKKDRDAAIFFFSSYCIYGEGYVEVNLTDEIVPYLCQLTEDGHGYTSVSLDEAIELKKPFSFYLYQKLVQHDGIKKSHEQKSNLQTSGVREFEIPLEAIFDMLPKSIDREWYSLNKTHITPALESINANTSMTIAKFGDDFFRKNKVARCVESITIKFYIQEAESDVFVAPVRPQLTGHPGKTAEEKLNKHIRDFEALEDYLNSCREWDHKFKARKQDLNILMKKAELIGRLPDQWVIDEFNRRNRSS